MKFALLATLIAFPFQSRLPELTVSPSVPTFSVAPSVVVSTSLMVSPAIRSLVLRLTASVPALPSIVYCVPAAAPVTFTVSPPVPRFIVTLETLLYIKLPPPKKLSPPSPPMN